MPAIPFRSQENLQEALFSDPNLEQILGTLTRYPKPVAVGEGRARGGGLMVYRVEVAETLGTDFPVEFLTVPQDAMRHEPHRSRLMRFLCHRLLQCS